MIWSVASTRGMRRQILANATDHASPWSDPQINNAMITHGAWVNNTSATHQRAIKPIVPGIPIDDATAMSKIIPAIPILARGRSWLKSSVLLRTSMYAIANAIITVEIIALSNKRGTPSNNARLSLIATKTIKANWVLACQPNMARSRVAPMAPVAHPRALKIATTTKTIVQVLLMRGAWVAAMSMNANTPSNGIPSGMRNTAKIAGALLKLLI